MHSCHQLTGLGAASIEILQEWYPLAENFHVRRLHEQASIATARGQILYFNIC